jgi:hypothetical protein
MQVNFDSLERLNPTLFSPACGETTDEAWAEANDVEEWQSTF